MSEKEIKEQLKKRPFEMDEYGLTGNTGLTGNAEGIIHINANYSATEGHVFVEVDMGDGEVESWERKKIEDVKPNDTIITCYYCDRSAISLDHSWPWLQEYTVCKEHHDKKNMLYKPIRKCRTVHECFYCGKDIKAGQKYFDGGYGKRCHVTCNKQTGGT